MSKINYQQELNDEQYRVVTQGDGPCLVLAGAGSGKTRTLVYRVAYLIEQGIPPDSILLVTFTNKAARQMLERIEQLLGSAPAGLWGGTFHHIGHRLLRRYGRTIGLEPGFTILDSDDAVSLIKLCARELPTPTREKAPKPGLIQSIISLAANLDQPIGSIIDERYNYLDPTIQSYIILVAERYQAKKLAAGAVDFDDLLVKWRDLVATSPHLRQKLTEQFQYILVDEYQDTNPIQSHIIRLMARDERPNVLVVGDDAQSIYSFRGATVDNILQFPRQYPESTVFKLQHNYRSTPEILALANASIRHNTRQYEKELLTTKGSALKPIVHACADARDQAAYVCDEIERCGRPQTDIAILFRSHFHSLELELELNSRGIPYVMRGGIRFFEQAHIKDVLAHIRLIDNHRDELAWLRVLALEPGIGEGTAREAIAVLRAQDSLPDVIALPSETVPQRLRPRWREVAARLRAVATAANVSGMIMAVVDHGYKQLIMTEYDNYRDRLEDLDQLALFAARGMTLSEFLAEAALGEQYGKDRIAERPQQDAVILSTIHQAKGLEWPVVFVIGLNDGQFPHSKVFDYPHEMEEERRLFYVAVTRAQEQLYLLYMEATRGDWAARPSQFIAELDLGVYDTGTSVSHLNDGDITYESDDQPRKYRFFK